MSIVTSAIEFTKWFHNKGWDTCSWDKNKFMIQETQQVEDSIEKIYSIFESEQKQIETPAHAPKVDVKVSAFIICAAIWYNDGKERPNLPRNIKTGIVVGGWRHGNCITMLHEMFPERDYIINNKDGKTTIQGFLTSKGMFVDRKEASEIAFEARQISTPDDCLFSEDLY